MNGKTTSRKFTSILIAMVMALGVFAFVSQPVHAGTDMANIDISDLDTADKNNFARPAESVWHYTYSTTPTTTSRLYMYTDNGNYTLLGKRKTLDTYIGGLGPSLGNAIGANLTLYNVEATSNSTITIAMGNPGGTTTLVGTNTFGCSYNNVAAVTINADNIYAEQTIKGSGTLIAQGSYYYALSVLNPLNITENASVIVKGAATYNAVRFGSSGKIRLGDKASLTIMNNSANPETITIEKYSAGNAYMWKLEGATPAESLTSANITVIIPPNSTGTITRELAPTKLAISKITVGKKQMKVTWKKAPAAQKITKYQVRYRVKGTSKWTTKTYAASASSATIKNLKKSKTYQVQVRSYKTSSGKNYFSPWSATKTSKKIK